MDKIKKGIGVLLEIEPMRTYDYEMVCGAIGNTEQVSYPEEFMIDVKKLGKLKDQGNINCCVGCVMASLAEIFSVIEDYGEEISDELWQEILKGGFEFSEGWAYGSLRTNYYGEGMYVSDALKNWSKYGILPKKLFDVVEEMPKMKEVVDRFPELKTKAEPYKIKSYATLNYAYKNKKDLAIKEALTKYGHGLLGVSYNYFGGAHCIMVVGWNDKTNCYKIKNSWGNWWGDEYGVDEIPKAHLDEVYLVLDEELKMPFVDVKEQDWFFKSVKNMYYSGLLKGITEKEFMPLKDTTRGEMATIIERIIKLTFERIELALKVGNEKRSINVENIMQKITHVSDKKFPFIDVVSNTWYYNSIKYCYEWGIIKGKTANEYKPEDSISRAEVATICVRVCDFIIAKLMLALDYCGNKNISTSILTQVINSELPNYSDVIQKDVNGNENWYFDYVNKAYQFDIMKGTDNNLFEPERNVNRAEIATLLNRLTKFLDIKNNILVEIF